MDEEPGPIINPLAYLAVWIAEWSCLDCGSYEFAKHHTGCPREAGKAPHSGG